MEVVDMIPAFNSRGVLPPGEYETNMKEIESRLGFNDDRKRRVIRLKEAIDNLQQAGVRQVWIDGSFVTSKANPADIDGCWDPVGVNADLLDPVFLDFSDFGRAMKEKYGIDFYPNVVEAGSGKIFSRFFQYDRNQQPRGILTIKFEQEDYDQD
jgi:hypothetical protein